MKNLFVVATAFCSIGLTSLSANAQGLLYSQDNTAQPYFEISTLDEASPLPIVAITIPELKLSPVKKLGNGVKAFATEMCSGIQFKFAQLMNKDVETIANLSLYGFINDWWHTRYRYGGIGKSGIDCSAFVGLLMGSVYAIKLPRTSREQYKMATKVSKDEMEEGDMVFFGMKSPKYINHVGFYLGDGYFVHSSLSQGVTISNINDKYYASRFVSGGRLSFYGLQNLIARY